MKIETLLPHSIISGLKCPQCSSISYSKNGKENSIQRFKCKKCGRNFRLASNSNIYRLQKKSCIEQYFQCMHDGLSLRKAADVCNISLGTAFRWRHRFLKCLSTKKNKIQSLETILSVLTLPYSQKGSRHLDPNLQNTIVNSSVIHSEEGIRLSLNLGRLSAVPKEKIGSSLIYYVPDKRMPRLTKQNLVPLKYNDRKIVLQEHSAVHDWLLKFRGVATKYLSNYWAWYNFEIDMQVISDETAYLLRNCVRNAS